MNFSAIVVLFLSELEIENMLYPFCISIKKGSYWFTQNVRNGYNVNGVIGEDFIKTHSKDASLATSYFMKIQLMGDNRLEKKLSSIGLSNALNW